MHTDPDEYSDALAYYGHLDRQIRSLRARILQHPDPRDPEYDEAAREALAHLEEAA